VTKRKKSETDSQQLAVNTASDIRFSAIEQDQAVEITSSQLTKVKI